MGLKLLTEILNWENAKQIGCPRTNLQIPKAEANWMQRRIVGSSLTWSAMEGLDIANVILLL